MYKNLYDNYYKWYHTKGDVNDNNILIISDTHFNDDESKEFRGEKYPGDDNFVKLINSKVGKKDTIIILGDVGDTEFIKKLRGYKVLIMGNHDKGASNYKKEVYHDFKWDTEFPKNLTYKDILKLGYKEVDATPAGFLFEKVTNNGLFDEIYEGPVMINDRLILSHEPIENLPPYMFNIHGHDHSGYFKSKQHLNVCAEHVNYTPVSLVSLLKNGLLKDINSIHRATIDAATVKKNKRKAEVKN